MSVVGAIRWDAWYSNTPGTVSYGAQQTLGLAQWRARLPWFYQIETNTSVAVHGTQTDMDQELIFANEAGLNFWAYDEAPLVGANSDMRLAWSLHQASPNKSLMNWCWISDLGSLGFTGNYSTQVTAYVTNFSDPQYQLVLTSRPLWFIMWNTSNYASHWGSSYTNVAAMITALRAACVTASIGNPYIVIMDFANLTHSITNFALEVNGIGADAIGFYNSSSYGLYPSLVNNCETMWTTYSGLGLNFVPTCVMGWDRRPFIQTPQPWYNTGGETIDQYANEGTIPQLMSHVKDGLAFIKANSSVCNSGALLIYAWTECVECGVNVLIPNYQNPPPSQLLSALKEIL